MHAVCGNLPAHTETAKTNRAEGPKNMQCQCGITWHHCFSRKVASNSPVKILDACYKSVLCLTMLHSYLHCYPGNLLRLPALFQAEVD